MLKDIFKEHQITTGRGGANGDGSLKDIFKEHQITTVAPKYGVATG